MSFFVSATLIQVNEYKACTHPQQMLANGKYEKDFSAGQRLFEFFDCETEIGQDPKMAFQKTNRDCEIVGILTEHEITRLVKCE